MHVAFVPFTGFRLREERLRQWNVSLPGLTRRASAVEQLPALGLLTLAGGTPDSWTCSYHPVERVTEELVDEIAGTRPALVAISALTASIDEAQELARQLRMRKIPTVIGGIHATVCAEEVGQHCDSVVIGSGESVWHEILADASAGHLRPRYQAENSATSQWITPRFDLLPQPVPRFTLQTHRGCPWACEFCGASRLLSQFQEKPIEQIRRELAAISAISPRPLLELADDNTFARVRDVDLLLDALQESGARWFTESDWRLGEQPDVLKRLAQSGCRQVLVGIESLVFRYPGQGKKADELARILEAVEAIQAAGVVVNGCCIAGGDGETPESLDRLTEFLLASPFAEIQVTLQTPFPGTGLYERLRRDGRLLAERGWSYYTLFDVTYRPDRMSVEELETGFENVLRHVYSHEASQRRDAIRHRVWRQRRSIAS